MASQFCFLGKTIKGIVVNRFGTINKNFPSIINTFLEWYKHESNIYLRDQHVDHNFFLNIQSFHGSEPLQQIFFNDKSDFVMNV